MPLVHHISKINYTILIWHIIEDEEFLSKGISLHNSDNAKFTQLKHPNKRKEFLALRQCLREYFGHNPEVFYTTNGKPYLDQNLKTSFSHTHSYAAIIVSNHPVGIDLEVYRAGMKRVAPKFMRDEESKSLDQQKQVEHLTQYWGAKETVVKIEGDRKLDFKKDIIVSPFTYSAEQQTTAQLINQNKLKSYELRFSYLEPVILTYGWQKV